MKVGARLVVSNHLEILVMRAHKLILSLTLSLAPLGVWFFNRLYKLVRL